MLGTLFSLEKYLLIEFPVFPKERCRPFPLNSRLGWNKSSRKGQRRWMNPETVLHLGKQKPVTQGELTWPPRGFPVLECLL